MTLPSTARAVKVLVVDDQPASRGLVGIWLSDGLAGDVEVLEAATLAEMREMWAMHRPDLVLLDQRLPDGEGLDGARELLAEDPDAAIIVLTGVADPALDLLAERSGVTDFLIKHEIDGPMLARTVRYALRRREDGRRLRRSEERYRNLVAALPDTAVVVVDDQLRFVMASGSALEQAGWDPATVVGRSVVEVLEEAGRPTLVEGYHDALAGVPREFEFTSPAGRTYRTAFRPLGDEAMAVTIDITEQLAQAVELQRAQALALTGSWSWNPGADRVTWSPELCRIYGVDPAQPPPPYEEFLETLVDPLYRERVTQVIGDAFEDGTAADFEMVILRTDGERRVLQSRLRPVRGADGVVVSIEGISQDVTELRTAQQHFEVAFDRAPIGMFLAGADGVSLRVNAALCGITGYARQELLARRLLDLVHPEDREAVLAELAGMADVDKALEHRMLHHDGHVVWVASSATLVRDAGGKPQHVLGQIQDITERREYEARLRHLADHDPLTGLLNRRGFEQALDAHIARTSRYGAAGALMVVDLDGFKNINDTLGHHAGDELLATCAAALTERLRDTDIVGRLGGDEFAVLLPVEGRPEAEIVAAALVAAVRQRAADFSRRGVGTVTASIGVAMVVAETVTGAGLLVDADRAMYAAKAAGRDRFAVFGETSSLPEPDAR